MNKTNLTHNEFVKLREKTEEEYKSIGEVNCPFLDMSVSFNSMGLDHIKFKEWNKARNQADQEMRLKLLHLAPQVLKKSHTVQGIEEGKRFERIKVNSRWEQKLVTVRYYEFIAVIKKCRVRVIVKRIGAAKPYFWSVIPYWKQGRLGKKLFTGDLETD